MIKFRNSDIDLLKFGQIFTEFKYKSKFKGVIILSILFSYAAEPELHIRRF